MTDQELIEFLRVRDWEKPRPLSGFWRGLRFVALVVAPLWVLFYFMVMR